MEKLVDDGLCKQIGISNFSCKKIDDLLSYARIKPAVLQVEVHPYFRNQQVIDHCKTKASHRYLAVEEHQHTPYACRTCNTPCNKPNVCAPKRGMIHRG